MSDDDRIRLMLLVKEGKISVQEAVDTVRLRFSRSEKHVNQRSILYNADIKQFLGFFYIVGLLYNYFIVSFKIANFILIQPLAVRTTINSCVNVTSEQVQTDNTHVNYQSSP